MPQGSSIARCFLAAFSLCALTISPVTAKPAKNRSPVASSVQGSVRTDLTPRDKNECLAVAKTLNEQVKILAKRAKKRVPQEFTRLAADLDESCGAEDFDKAWISIEWMNGCLNNFTKDEELGFCSKNEGYFCAINPRSDACLQSQ